MPWTPLKCERTSDWGQFETMAEVAAAIDAAPDWRAAFDDYMKWEFESGRQAAHEQAVDPDTVVQDEFHYASWRMNQAIKRVQLNERTEDECIEQSQICFLNGMRQGFLECGAVDTDEQRYDSPAPQQPEIQEPVTVRQETAGAGPVPRDPQELLAKLRARVAEKEQSEQEETR